MGHSKHHFGTRQSGHLLWVRECPRKGPSSLSGLSCQNAYYRWCRKRSLFFLSPRGYKKPRHLVGVPSVIAPNRLQRQFTVDRADSAWVTDITYIRTLEGWLYLAVVMDLHSRKIVGWSMQPTLARGIVVDALLMAVWKRKPKERVVVHSDQGSQYGSDDWLRFCKAHKLDPSKSRRGNCWDNAVAESFFSSLKKERIRRKIYRTRSLAGADIFDYVEMFYNRTRRHSHLGGVSPEAFENASKQAL